ncbi:MAG: SH3 domain-containing protein [Candidatus Schekmanbacteria bacterium]|nr:SH3 domain-containing protein [Candidatus Schekmanbacteria bacterium]
MQRRWSMQLGMRARNMCRAFAASATMLLVAAAIGAGCQQPKSEVTTDLAPATADFRYRAARDAAFLDAPDVRASVVATLVKGDRLMMVEQRGAWVRARRAGDLTSGWVYADLLEEDTLSPWWSGDTEAAKEAARVIYREKSTASFDIEHVAITEGLQQMELRAKPEAEFDQERAKACLRGALSLLKSRFPAWKEHKVLLQGTRAGEQFLSAINSDEEVTFF